MEGKTQETAAAKAGMSVRSARKWQSGPLPSATKPEHWWRTRPDPFDGVWEDEIEPLLRNDPTGKLKATTIIDWLTEEHPGRFSASQLRTRIASNHMLLNFGYRRSSGRSSHEIGDNWPPSSGRLAAMHRRIRFGYPSFRRPPTY